MLKIFNYENPKKECLQSYLSLDRHKYLYLVKLRTSIP